MIMKKAVEAYKKLGFLIYVLGPKTEIYEKRLIEDKVWTVVNIYLFSNSTYTASVKPSSNSSLNKSQLFIYKLNSSRIALFRDNTICFVYGYK